MSIDDAVDLVLEAFEKARPGDIFVQKAPAVSLGTLVEALKKIFRADNPVRVIGTRHGEKLYETLLTREEMVRAEDLGEYFRIPADTRDLNYNLYINEGQERVSKELDYTSHNTRRLSLEEMADLLLKLGATKRSLEESPS
jgi:UDP-N-acetylglucosamine 4,6-dehydratase/5-epimerase